MLRKILLITNILVTFCFSTVYIAQAEDIDKSAQASADKYLKGMTISDLPEGLQMISDSSWPMWGSKPVLLKHETIFESMIETDVPSIKGYKRLIDSQVKSKAGTPLPTRSLLIAYPGFRDKKWRVLVFSTGTNVQNELSAAKRDLGDTKYNTKDQFNYRRAAYWYSATGMLNDSYAAYKKASDLNKIDPSDHTKQADFEVNVVTLEQILDVQHK